MTSHDLVIKGLLQRNEEWAKTVVKADPDFFTRSAREPQTPQVLWIGCSDSRVPASVVTGSKPGDLFVHRNIANQVPSEDNNVLSVLDYAVGHIKVKHVIVVGHTECGGAKHCLEAAKKNPPTKPDTPLLHWLEPLTQLARDLNLGSLPPAEALPILIRTNVSRQIETIVGTKTIRTAWGLGQEVWIHGFIYDLSTGHLSDLGVSVSKESHGK